MSKITNLFSRLETSRRFSFAGDETSTDSGSNQSQSPAILQGSDVAAFERLGENQKTIEHSLSYVFGGLNEVQGLIDKMSTLTQQLGTSFEEHRRLALANASLARDRDRAEQNLCPFAPGRHAAPGFAPNLRGAKANPPCQTSGAC